MKMPIDHIMEWLVRTGSDYWDYLCDAPTHFTEAHWAVFSFIACMFGFFCMRGFGSRTKY